MKKIILVSISVLMVLALGACQGTPDISGNLEDLDGETVQVSGYVRSTIQVPFTDLTVYYMGAGDEIYTVISADQRLNDEEVRFEGTVYAYDGAVAEEAPEDVRAAIESVVEAAGLVDVEAESAFDNAFMYVRRFVLSRNHAFFIVEN